MIGVVDTYIWTMQSKPIIDPSGVRSPIMKAVPVVLQFPEFVKTSSALWPELREPMTKRGIMMANRPRIWTNNSIASIRGNFRENEVLKRIAKATQAITSRVPCHGWGT